MNLLSLVVWGIHPSVNAADKAKAEELNVTRGALYQKLNGVEIGVSAALVRETTSELGQFIQQMGGQHSPCWQATKCEFSMAMHWRQPSID